MTKDELIKAIKDSGLSKRDFAESIGRSVAMLRRYERGHNKVPKRVVDEIEQILAAKYDSE